MRMLLVTAPHLNIKDRLWRRSSNGWGLPENAESQAPPLTTAFLEGACDKVPGACQACDPVVSTGLSPPCVGPVVSPAHSGEDGHWGPGFWLLSLEALRNSPPPHSTPPPTK